MGCGQRHWFSAYGWPGRRLTHCARYGCNAPNPNWPAERDEQILMFGEEMAGKPGRLTYGRLDPPTD